MQSITSFFALRSWKRGTGSDSYIVVRPGMQIKPATSRHLRVHLLLGCFLHLCGYFTLCGEVAKVEGFYFTAS